MVKLLLFDFMFMLIGIFVENEFKDFWCIVDIVQLGLFGLLSYFYNEYVLLVQVDFIEVKCLKLLLVDKSYLVFMLCWMKEDYIFGLFEKIINEVFIEML